MSGEEGRSGARARAPGGRRRPDVAARRARGRMIARPAPRIFVSAGEPSGDLHGAGVVQALRARYPDADDRGAGRPAHGGGRGARSAIPMEGLAAFGLVEVVTKLRAHVRLLRALRADFRAGRYDLVILIDYPGFHVRVAEAARRGGHQSPLLHCAPALGLAAGPGAAVRVGGRPAGGGAAVRAALLRRARAPERLRRPPAGGPGRLAHASRGPRAARHSAGEPGAGHLSGEPAAGDRAAVAAVPRRGAAACSTRGAATGCWSRAPPSGEYPDPGPLTIAPRRPDPGVRRGRCGARQVGHDDARGRAGGRADGGRLQGASADLAHVPAASHGRMGEPGQSRRRAGGGAGDAAGPRRGRRRSPTRSGRCSIRAIPARWPSGKGSRSCGSGSARRAPPPGWWRWPTSCCGA